MENLIFRFWSRLTWRGMNPPFSAYVNFSIDKFFNIYFFLGIYKLALTHKKLGIPKEILATKVIPFLMPLTIENGLTMNQFNTLFAVLKDMINRVETEHRTKIEQLNAISQQTK